MADFRITQRTKFHPHRNQCLRDKLLRGADDGHSRVEHHGLAAHALQLLARTLKIARLSNGLAVQISHLVRADDHAVPPAVGYGAGFGQGQSDGGLIRRFSR